MTYVTATPSVDDTQQPAIELSREGEDLVGQAEFEGTEDAYQAVRDSIVAELRVIEEMRERERDMREAGNMAHLRLRKLQAIEFELVQHL